MRHCQLLTRGTSYQSSYNFHCLTIDHFHTIGCLGIRDYSCTCIHISHDILRIYVPTYPRNKKIMNLLTNAINKTKILFMPYT